MLERSQFELKKEKKEQCLSTGVGKWYTSSISENLTWTKSGKEHIIINR